MVMNRGGGGSSSSHQRSRKRILSPSAFAIFIILLFIFSFLIFNFYSRDILVDPQLIPGHHSQPSLLQNLLLPDEQLWEAPSSYSLRQCVKPTAKYKAFQAGDHYITVRSNGGLNQMRTGISDMVAVARMMNATLVIPQLDKRSFWQDTSVFSDIFDEPHFISTLERDVRVVKELPNELNSVPRARKHFTSWSGLEYYLKMTELWRDYQVVHVAKSDSRLANNDLPLDIQRLRCRTLYNALRFSRSIESLGKKLVARLRMRARRYVALHLRYEKDMLSFSGCTYGLSDNESEELRLMREVANILALIRAAKEVNDTINAFWESTNHWKIKSINSTEQRLAGLCPLTPKEVGVFLQALGYPSSTLIYIAAGEIYGGKTRLSELTASFPNVVFKETIASKEELKYYFNHASQTAALDYIISVESDIFVPSYSGNMARTVEGHRRFLGHRKTISPDRRGLVEIFDNLEKGTLNGALLPHLVKQLHKNRQGAPRKRAGAPAGVKGRARFRSEESFYQNPYPECICAL